MGACAYLVNAVTASLLSSDTEDSSYPLENLVDEIVAKVFRFTSGTTGYVEINFGTPTALTGLFVVNHNVTQAAGSVTITAGNSTPPGTSIATPSWRQYDIGAVFASQTYQYWRVTFADTNTDSLEFGNLVAGTVVNFPRRYSYAQVKGIHHEDLYMKTIRGVPYVYPLYGHRLREFLFQPLTEAEADEFETFDLAVGGRSTPFILIPDVAVTPLEFFFGRKQLEQLEQGSDNSFMSYRLLFEEDSRGVDVE